ncbi:MAG: DsbA family oxidoreductase [Bdellovibrionales bacterium]|nr:DsbA family oxidoreductase [Massilia sp.]
MKQLRIDFVSDISCPWCVIGLRALEQAIAKADDAISVEMHFHPFELNPQMAPEGEDMAEHLARKYGASAEQGAKTREMIRARGAEVGFRFDMDARSRIYNTFDAHRLMHWAELQGRERELQMKLFEAYFTKGENPASHEVLTRVAGEIGLDAGEAADVLAGGAYADEVRERVEFFQRQGISAVPAIIVNQRHLISGGQTPEVFEQALRQIASQVP